MRRICTSPQAGLPDLSHLTWGRFLARNLVPVTLGNIAGAVLMGRRHLLVRLLRKAAEPEAVAEARVSASAERRGNLGSRIRAGA